MSHSGTICLLFCQNTAMQLLTYISTPKTPHLVCSNMASYFQKWVFNLMQKGNFFTIRWSTKPNCPVFFFLCDTEITSQPVAEVCCWIVIFPPKCYLIIYLHWLIFRLESWQELGWVLNPTVLQIWSWRAWLKVESNFKEPSRSSICIKNHVVT